MTNVVQREPFRIEDLHSDMVLPLRALTVAMRASPVNGYVLQPFEGYRSPMRQNYLFSLTPKVTKARAWQSAHQYGLAVDFAGLRIENDLIVPNSWSWDVNESLWVVLKREAVKAGLDVPIAWDRGHVIHPSVYVKHGLK